MRLKLTLSTCILLYATLLWSQSTSVSLKSSIADVSISQITSDDGLPSNNINSVYQDSKDLIWITSNNGFMIYDGERIQTYDKSRLEFLNNDGFYAVAENDEGTVFIASKGDGIVQFKGGVFNLYQPKGVEIPKSIRTLLVASDGSLYLGSNYEGIYRIKNDSAYKVTDERFDRTIIRVIIEGSNKDIWFGTEGNGLNHLGKSDIRSLTTKNGLLSNNVMSLFEYARRLYVGTSKGLQWLDDQQNFHTVSPLENNSINSLLLDDSGMVWVGSEGGVACWNEADNRLEWFRSKQGIDLVRISSMIMDEESNIWLSSNRSGLIQIKESRVSNFVKPDLSSSRVNIVHESWNGNLYIGTDANQIDVYDGKTFHILPVKTNLNGNGVRDIYHDRDGSFWLATYSGILHMGSDGEQLFSTASGMPADNFRVIHKDKNDNFWFGTRSGGLIKFRNGEIISVYSDGHGLESNFVFSIAESAKGEIYVGTFGGGMTIINQQGDARTFHLSDDDSGLLFFNIDFDEEENAYITTNNGPLFFKGDSLIEVKLQQDKRSRTFFDLIIDQQEHLWITTNLGVLQLKKSDWEKYLNNRLDRVPTFTVDQSSGMNTEECTGATRSTITSNGSIYVPTLGGASIIDPSTFKRNQYLPKVSIRQMIADDKEVNIHIKPAECQPGTSRYRFDFSVLSFGSPERNQFKYKLEGYDKGWSAATYEGTVEYTNLSPGDYTFKVIGTNDGHVWNEEGDSLAFTVHPFYYETTWFLALCIGIVLLTIFLFFTWRVAFINNQNRELRKVNAELDRFVYSASHEMRSPLSSILGLINVASLDKTPNKEEYLAYIKNSVERLDSLLQDIVDHSKNARTELEIAALDLKLEVEEVIEGLTYSENFPKIESIIECNGDGMIHSDVNRLKIVLNNLITNAYKHHSPDDVSNPFVKVVIDKTEAGVRLTIADNGPGIPAEEQEKVFNMFYRATHKSDGTGLGLYIVKEIITNLNGSIEVDSEVGKGTTFIIELVDLRN
ncbi:two-component regulator propeller domain-containing protein [Reichenbachiella sp.]|uniref:sensor histidine kinase n=1 Tax=Reichenbachiella sp. TaxID=2184521 RepID=UPI003BB208BA